LIAAGAIGSWTCSCAGEDLLLVDLIMQKILSFGHEKWNLWQALLDLKLRN